MPPVADLSKLDSVADQLVARAHNGERFCVVGHAGAGRGHLLSRLTKQVTSAVAVRLPELTELDAATHGLLQSAAGLNANLRAAAVDETIPFRARVRKVSVALAGAGVTLLVKLPSSWCGPLFLSKTPLEAFQKERARELLLGWVHTDNLGLVTLGAPMVSSVGSPLEDLPEVPLARLLADITSLEDASLWDSYADAAQALREQLHRNAIDLTPVQLRCMVGLVKLGVQPSSLLAELASRRKSTPIADLRFFGEKWRKTLRQHQSLQAAVRRFMRARFALPRDVAVAVSGIAASHTPLLTACLGYGDDVTHVSERLRTELIGPMDAAYEDGHVALADYHEKLDGMSSVIDAQGVAVLHWLEKAHHLAHGGERTRDRWERLVPPGREFLWARARALSIADKDYLGAADVYQRCVDTYGDDGYSWHYLGFNLDRAGTARKRAEDALRRAVKLDPRNPWWNSRLVTFLIDQARFRDAELEWIEAVERVDPEGDVIQRSEWLARQLHRWVATEWLEAGETKRARDVFELIPNQIVQNSPVLQHVLHQIEDALEALALGESVYPQGTPIEERWQSYRCLEQYNAAKERLRSWFPGRVLSAESTGVQLVLAVPEDNPKDRRVIVRELSREEWMKASGDPPESAAGFIELGIYADDSVVVRSVLLPDTIESAERPEDELRHLRSWG